MAVGAGLSYLLIDRIAVAAGDAYRAYRERFLIEKSGGDLAGEPSCGGADLAEDDEAIGVIELLREEDVLPTSIPSDSEDRPDN